MSTKNELAPSGGPTGLAMQNQSKEAMDLIRSTIAADCNEQEFALFMEVAKRTGLDPFMKQIFPIARWSNTQDEKGNWSKVKKITHQTSIDGFRLIADRTGQYAGSSAPIYSEQLIGDKYPEWAKVVVKKIIVGRVFEIEAVAYWDEFKQEFKGKLGTLWLKMPRHMLAKCAESLALRKAFPAELSGIYNDDEMGQAANTAPENTEPEEPKNITPQSTPKTEDQQPEATPIVENKEQIADITFRISKAESMKELKGISDDIAKLHSEKKIGEKSQNSIKKVYRIAYARLKPVDAYDNHVAGISKANTLDELIAVEGEASKDKSITTEQAVALQEKMKEKHDAIVEAQGKKGGDADDIPFS